MHPIFRGGSRKLESRCFKIGPSIWRPGKRAGGGGGGGGGSRHPRVRAGVGSSSRASQFSFVVPEEITNYMNNIILSLLRRTLRDPFPTCVRGGT
jgi:hypothetical protein